MKKHLLLFLTMILPMMVNAEYVMIGKIYYSLSENEAKVYPIYNDNLYDSYFGDIIIPESVTYNGKTYNVTSIGERAFYKCPRLTSITIPNSVTSIGDFAFCACTGLTTITIGSGVTSIGNYAFRSCSSVKNVYCLPENIPSTGSSPFDSSPYARAHLYVPKRSLERYKSVYPWSGFGGFLPITKTITYIVDNELYKSYEIEYLEPIALEAEPTKEGYSFSGWSSIPETMPYHDVVVTGSFSINSYTLTYLLDGEVYKTESVVYGTTLVPEPALTKEGYTFSGWSKIPSTMPASDVIVTGSFAVNEYMLTYVVDGVEYKTLTVAYGTALTPEEDPTKEGYTFSGWSEIPNLMPAHDVVIIGSFAINSYTLLYVLDGDIYKMYSIEYGAVIVPETVFKKEGYTFSGWHNLPETMPANDVIAQGQYNINSHTLTYKVDGRVYKTYTLEYHSTITPEAAPVKEGHTFSGWSEIPDLMPDNDVVVTGSFIVNSYTLTYMVDGEEYKTSIVVYGTSLTPEAIPTKEGYTFSGWSEIPTTMPAHDVVVTGSFTINSYTLTYKVDGNVYKTSSVVYGTSLTPEAIPTKEGYTFSGWSEIPATMPAHNVVITGSFSINSYTLTYMVDGKEYKISTVTYGTTITPETAPTKEGYTFTGWSNLPATMPAHDVIVEAQWSINQYLLTYIIDGEEYKSCEVDYNTALTPESVPVKKGMTFSGWGNVPEKMPAYDLTLSGTYSWSKETVNDIIYQVADTLNNYVSVIGTDNIIGEAEILSSIEIGGDVYIVNSIGCSAFEGCNNLTSINISEGVTTIGDGAFSGCSKLTSVNLESNAIVSASRTSDTSMKAIFGNQVGKYVIGSSVNAIGDYAFYGCNALTSITIPSSVASFGNNAFDGCNSVKFYVSRGSDALLYIWNNYINDPYEIDTSQILSRPNISVTSTTQSSITCWIENLYPELEYLCNDGSLEDNTYLLKGLRPNYTQHISLKVLSPNNMYSTSTDATTASISPMVISKDITASSISVVSSYTEGDAKVVSSLLTMDGREMTGVEGYLHGLKPNTSYNCKYTVVVEYGEGETYSYEYSTNIRTAALTLTTQQPKVISVGNVVVAAESNLDDEETNVGFEWRRTDWTDDFASNSGAAYLYEGTMEGYIRNLYTEKLWKYRPYYESDSGKRYYGNWVGIDPTNTSYFEPTVHTYATITVTGNRAEVKGYAMRGTDNVTTQGFMYWPNRSSYTLRKKAASIPSDAITITTAKTNVMTATLEDLEYETEYCCVAFVTTSEDETFYGEPKTFSTSVDPDGIREIKDESLSSAFSKGEGVWYSLDGKKLDKPQRGINIIRYSDGTSKKVLVK